MDLILICHKGVTFTPLIPFVHEGLAFECGVFSFLSILSAITCGTVDWEHDVWRVWWKAILAFVFIKIGRGWLNQAHGVRGSILCLHQGWWLDTQLQVSSVACSISGKMGHGTELPAGLKRQFVHSLCMEYILAFGCATSPVFNNVISMI